MACTRPIRGHRQPNGSIKPSYQRGSTPSVFDAVTFTAQLTVPCRSCTACLLEDARHWAIRICGEASFWANPIFATLTYDDEHCPFELQLDHWQNFAKKWRRDIGKMRFFHAGEYGGETFRPHYHAAIFTDHYFADSKTLKKTKRGDTLWKSAELSALWPHGFINYGELNFNSAGYIARYTLAKKGGPARHEWRNIKQPYVTMSRNPGIGKKWIQKWMKDAYPSDFLIHNGHKVKPPKYYDRILGETNEKLLAHIKQTRLEQAELHADDNTNERLIAKEKVLQAKINTYLQRPLE